MRIALTYQAAMTRFAELSGPEYPPHVQVKEVAKIAAELSPNNPLPADVVRALYAEASPDELTHPPSSNPDNTPTPCSSKMNTTRKRTNKHPDPTMTARSNPPDRLGSPPSRFFRPTSSLARLRSCWTSKT